MEKVRKPKRVWKGIRSRPMSVNHCVHCGKPLQVWEVLQNAFYHAACILQIKRQRL